MKLPYSVKSLMIFSTILTKSKNLSNRQTELWQHILHQHTINPTVKIS